MARLDCPITQSSEVRLNWLKTISGVNKSELVDISLNLLFSAVAQVSQCEDKSQKEAVIHIAESLPIDKRSRIPEIDLNPSDTTFFIISKGESQNESNIKQN